MVGITEIDLAWMAGFLDGEGSIMLGKGKRGNKTFYYYRKITISNTRKDILEFFMALFGGTIIQSTRHNENKNSKDMFFWAVASKEAERFLIAIYPYIKLKKIQADLFLNYSKHIPPYNGGPGNKLSEEQKEIRDGFIFKMQESNRRGRLCQLES